MNCQIEISITTASKPATYFTVLGTQGAYRAYWKFAKVKYFFNSER